MTAAKKSGMDMTQGAPGKILFLFAFPMIVGNLFQQFYQMADSVIIGRFVGEEALAAVGSSAALTTVFVMLAIGGGNGAAVLISQYLGAKRYRELKTAVSTALLFFGIIGSVLAVIGFCAARRLLILLHTPESVTGMAAMYLQVYFIGLPFLFLYNILSSIFQAMGDSKTPLYLLIFSSVLNIVLDLFFVVSLGYSVKGVAAATVLAQGIAAVWSFILLCRRFRAFDAGKGQGFTWFDRMQLGTMLKIALPTMLQQSIVSIGMLLVQSVVNSFGAAAMAGYAASGKIESICLVPMLATGNAVATFTAQNMGAQDTERVRRGYRASYVLLFGFAVLTGVCTWFGREAFIRLFLGTDGSSEAMETGVACLSFMAFVFILIGLKATTDGVLRGSGDMTVFTVSNLVNLAIRVLFANCFAPVLGIAAVWYAVPLGWAANYLISLLRYRSGKWKTRQVIRESRDCS